MFNVSKAGIITVNRGDSFELPIVLNLGNSLEFDRYAILPKDTVYVGVMEPNQPFECALIRKKLGIDDLDEDGNLIVRFESTDTECLLPGKYYYQVKLQTLRDAQKQLYDVETVVDKTLFYIQE